MQEGEQQEGEQQEREQQKREQQKRVIYPEGVNGIEVANIINNPDPNIQYQLGVDRVGQMSCRVFLGTFATVSVLSSAIIYMASDLSPGESIAFGMFLGFAAGVMSAYCARAFTFPSNINERNLNNAGGIRNALLHGGGFYHA